MRSATAATPTGSRGWSGQISKVGEDAIITMGTYSFCRARHHCLPRLRLCKTCESGDMVLARFALFFWGRRLTVPGLRVRGLR